MKWKNIFKLLKHQLKFLFLVVLLMDQVKHVKQILELLEQEEKVCYSVKVKLSEKYLKNQLVEELKKEIDLIAEEYFAKQESEQSAKLINSSYRTKHKAQEASISNARASFFSFYILIKRTGI